MRQTKRFDRALQLKPEGFLWLIKAQLAISEKGDLTVAEKLFEKAKSFPMSKEEKLNQMDFLLLQRKYKELLETAQNSSDDLLTPRSHALKYIAIGLAQKGLHDETSARSALLKAKNIYEEQVKQKPDDAFLHVELAKLNAWLGDRDAALSEAQRATQLRPESKDAYYGPRITGQVAKVHAILGDNDRAIELLDGLLNRPSDLTVSDLKLNPAWDPLRNDPRFQKLCEEKQH
jgi:tetratricopeptide (TPR) repeat protein